MVKLRCGDLSTLMGGSLQVPLERTLGRAAVSAPG
jgi:hypothetical protein